MVDQSSSAICTRDFAAGSISNGRSSWMSALTTYPAILSELKSHFKFVAISYKFFFILRSEEKRSVCVRVQQQQSVSARVPHSNGYIRGERGGVGAHSCCGRFSSRFSTQLFSCSATPTLWTRTSAVWASMALHSSSICWICSITAPFSSSIRLFCSSTLELSKLARSCRLSTVCDQSVANNSRYPARSAAQPVRAQLAAGGAAGGGAASG
jgi:hypothetical protein